MKGDALDPGGLIAESYRIDDIGRPEAREIFLGWALKLAPGQDMRSAITEMLKRHGHQPADHPMTLTLTEGLNTAAAPRRRGGRSGRG